MDLLEPIRRWIDGKNADDPLASFSTHARQRRAAEEFLVKVAREVDFVMRREMFTPPGGLTYIPPEYIVYLSSEDDKGWQGEKRRGLQRGLFNVLSARARELSGLTQLVAKSFTIELRVDGTLNKGQFRVQPVWDSEKGQTVVTPRPKYATSGTPSVEAGEAGEITKVRPRPRAVLYSVEVRRDGARRAVVPVTKPEIKIGRGSQSVEVDLPIKGDPEVSRHHATIVRDATGRLWLIPKGQNPTFVAGREIPREERCSINPDDEIKICSHTLSIRLK